MKNFSKTLIAIRKSSTKKFPYGDTNITNFTKSASSNYVTIGQTLAYLSTSSGNPFNSNYTTGTESEIKLIQTNNKMREFDSQYGLYFTSNKVKPNNSHQPIKIQAYCRNGNNKLSAKKNI